MLCLGCQNETNNPKFCSRKCAAKINNVNYPKRKKIIANCKNCGKVNKTYIQQFCSRECLYQYKWKERVIEIESRGFIHDETCFARSHTARHYLEYKFGKKCSICNIDKWMDKPLIMIVDHINGKPNDWSLTNLRFVCSNCDSQLPTYKSKNTGNGGRPIRRVIYK